MREVRLCRSRRGALGLLLGHKAFRALGSKLNLSEFVEVLFPLENARTPI